MGRKGGQSKGGAKDGGSAGAARDTTADGAGDEEATARATAAAAAPQHSLSTTEADDGGQAPSSADNRGSCATSPLCQAAHVADTVVPGQPPPVTAAATHTEPGNMMTPSAVAADVVVVVAASPQGSPGPRLPPQPTTENFEGSAPEAPPPLLSTAPTEAAPMCHCPPLTAPPPSADLSEKAAPSVAGDAAQVGGSSSRASATSRQPSGDPPQPQPAPSAPASLLTTPMASQRSSPARPLAATEAVAALLRAARLSVVSAAPQQASALQGEAKKNAAELCKAIADCTGAVVRGAKARDTLRKLPPFLGTMTFVDDAAAGVAHAEQATAGLLGDVAAAHSRLALVASVCNGRVAHATARLAALLPPKPAATAA